MKRGFGISGVVLLLAATGCNVADSGPVLTASEEVDAGKAESAGADIRMGAGTLHIEGGAAKLLSGSFRYSEKVGRPTVRYEVTGDTGRLTVESPKDSSSGGKAVNEWDLRMGSGVPLKMNVTLGAGESKLDMSQLPLQSLEVNMGAGEMMLDVSGKYTKDVTVDVNGGVGEAEIRLPKGIGAEVRATGGIGNISTKGLTQRDGKYYNDAYAEDKPAVRVHVQGGIGNITFKVGE